MRYLIKNSKILMRGGLPKMLSAPDLSSSSSSSAFGVAYVFDSYTGSSQSFTVPTGASTMKVWVIGGGSGGAYDATAGCPDFQDGYYGGEAVKTYSVTPGNTVSYYVGKGGAAGSNATSEAGETTSATYSGVTVGATGGCALYACSTDGSGSGGDFNRSFYAGNTLDFEGRVDVLQNFTGSGFTGNVSGGSNLITNISPAGILGAGQPIYGMSVYSPYFPNGALISSVDSPTQVSLTTTSASYGENISFSNYKLNAGFRGTAAEYSSTGGANGAVIMYFT